MERSKRKAINFDLDTNIMKKRKLYPKGYDLLREAFIEQGFTHRQGSGYLSVSKLTSDQVYDIIGKVVKEQPWLADCVKKIDVTDIGRQHDLTDFVREVAAEQAEQAEPARQAERKNTKEKLTAEDEKLIARIKKTPKGAEFDTLYNGGEITGDRARDDFKLMNALGFFSDKNREQMQRIFQSSGRYRPELGREYLDRLTDTVLKAFERPAPSAGGGRSNNRGNGGYKGK